MAKWEIRFKPDPATIADEYEKFFGDQLHSQTRAGRSRARTLMKLRALKNPTADEIEAIIGIDVWTQVKCDVCHKPQDAVIAIEATNGEAEVECLQAMSIDLAAAFAGRRES